MNIHRNTLAWLGVLGLVAIVYPAGAQSKLQASSELTGIENVLGVIRNVDPQQADSKSNRFILDIMDAKGEIELQNSVLSGSKASVTTQGRRLMKRATPLPPARRLKAF